MYLYLYIQSESDLFETFFSIHYFLTFFLTNIVFKYNFIFGTQILKLEI